MLSSLITVTASFCQFPHELCDTVMILKCHGQTVPEFQSAEPDTAIAFLPLDEAIASRAVFVIASGSDGRTGGRKRYWSQLNNSKTVRDRPYVSIGS